MSNEKKEVNVWERLFKLWAMICKMIMDEIRDPEKVAKMLESVVNVLQAIVDEPAVVKKYLRQLFTDLEVGATDGTETFKSSGLFTGGIYGLAVPIAAKGKATLVTKATVWEMILDGMFSLLFGSLGQGRKRWTEAQVVRFCRDHRDKLRTQGYATFFEMEGDVVASVYFDDSGQLHVYVYSFSYDDDWYATYRHRLVSLQ